MAFTNEDYSVMECFLIDISLFLLNRGIIELNRLSLTEILLDG